MPCRCLAACLLLLALVGVNDCSSGREDIGCGDGKCHRSCEACTPSASVRTLSLVQVSEVRSRDRTRHYDEDDEPQSFIGPALMQGSSIANKTVTIEGVETRNKSSAVHDVASARGVVSTNRSSAVHKDASAQGVGARNQSSAVHEDVSVFGPHAESLWHSWHGRWHSWLHHARNKMLVLTEFGSRKVQIAEAASQGSMGTWGWVGLAIGIVFVLTFIVFSLGHDKHQDHHGLPNERASVWPPNVDVARPSVRPSAKLGPRASMKMGRPSISVGGPRGSIVGEGLRSPPVPGGARSSTAQPGLGKNLSDQSLGPTVSYDVRTFAGARSAQHISAVPESERELPMTASATEPPSSHSSKLDVGAYLCPDLVVPPSCECSLRVPAKAGADNSLDVTDMNGYEVMRVMFRKQAGQDKILLITGYGDVLAQCGPAPGSRGEFHLLRAHGEFFGKLVQGSARDEATVRTASGAELMFRGSGHTVNITDTWGRLLAMTEPETGGITSAPGKEAYLLRVAPLMDVSIVICGLLIIQHLKKT